SCAPLLWNVRGDSTARCRALRPLLTSGPRRCLMQIGVHVPTTVAPDVTREALLTFAREAEARDFVSLWVSDHVVIPRATAGYPGGRSFPVPPDVPYLEPVAMLSAVAVATTRARIGCSVFILGHRHPVALRRVVALGDGWHAMSKAPDELRASLAELRALADAAGRAWKTIEISMRFELSEKVLADGAQAVVDRLGEYARLGVSHTAVVFRREDPKRMMELLDLVARKIRPALVG